MEIATRYIKRITFSMKSHEVYHTIDVSSSRKHHMVFVAPKYIRKVFYADKRLETKEIIRELYLNGNE